MHVCVSAGVVQTYAVRTSFPVFTLVLVAHVPKFSPERVGYVRRDNFLSMFARATAGYCSPGRGHQVVSCWASSLQPRHRQHRCQTCAGS